MTESELLKERIALLEQEIELLKAAHLSDCSRLMQMHNTALDTIDSLFAAHLSDCSRLMQRIADCRHGGNCDES